MNEKMKLSSPWINFYREIQVLFNDDPDVKITYDEDENKINLYVEDTNKANALTQILPTEKTFGNITVKIAVIPTNMNESTIPIDLFEIAFKDNPAFSYSKRVESPGSIPFDYVVFKNKVVQYFNDNLGDINGLRSTLYQDIAADIFEDSHIHFCTDIKEPIFTRGINRVKKFFNRFKKS